MPDARPGGGGGAVFLDRDGTLAHDPGYLHDPHDVRLLPGVAEGLRRLTAAAWPLVLVSNQSGIARGLYGPEAFGAVNRRIEELSGPPAVRFAAEYFCPHHPDIGGPCECRKPAPALFRRAAADLGLDLGRCWFVGNRVGDVSPAIGFGGRGVLVPGEGGRDEAEAAREMGIPVAADFLKATSFILAAAP